ncbi:MAG: AAA family ATPase, partial [Coleofasciculaceae cyanobacterium RL_1_1]|nr:AAA family ATPase [Coleofasciculaceae cyanobacterium RL_1_1]
MAYVLECLQILYGAFFKPFSLQHQLRTIHPELSPWSSPFELRSEFATNPRLKRYANQAWLLSAIAPLLITAIVAPLYTLFARETFDWVDPGLFFLGWWIGLLFARGDNQSLSIWADRSLYGFTAIVLLFALSRNFAPELIQPILEVFQNQPNYSTIFNVLGLVAFGVAG